MPALVMFKRKWLISCDDLVIPFAIEAVIRIGWLIASVTFFVLKYELCENETIIIYLFYSAILEVGVTSILSIIITYTSAQGSTMEVEKRRCLPKLLYSKLATTLLEFFIASFTTWLVFIYIESNTCVQSEIGVFIKFTSICVYVYCFILCFGICVCYDSLGSSVHWDSDQSNFMKKAEDIWQFRLKFFCCCIGNYSENKSKYTEISTFLASFLNNIDLVPTDIVAGLATLAKKHASEKHLRTFYSKTSNSLHFGKSPIQPWMTIGNALHFLRIAKSTYGWLAFCDVLNPCNLCVLMPYVRCCNRNSNTDNIRSDNMCYCGSAALQKITGFCDADIVYASFHSDIYKPSFYVALDHQTRSVVIAIRGTLSLSDLVTDIDAESQALPQENGSNQFICHRGVLQSAMFLHKTITELNLLPSAFAEHPNYCLVLTGHSLGGSVASILAYLLKPQYPDLQCYAFAPLAALSANMAEETLNFVFSIVVGDDLSARLCVNSCKTVRSELIKSLHDTQVPKINEPSLKENDTKLHAPGRILHLTESPSGCISSWVTGSHFDRIIISWKMMHDHQPHTIQAMLEQQNQLQLSQENINYINNSFEM